MLFVYQGQRAPANYNHVHVAQTALLRSLHTTSAHELWRSGANRKDPQFTLKR